MMIWPPTFATAIPLPLMNGVKQRRNDTAALELTPVGSDWTLLSQGAEAKVYLVPIASCPWSIGVDVSDQSQHVIVKHRFPKSYRHATLDQRLTTQRTRAEVKLLQKCAQNCIPVPHVYLHRDVPPNTILLQYMVDYQPVRSCLRNFITANDRQLISLTLWAWGAAVGRLHRCGIVHGDLTTSNALLHANAITQLANDNKPMNDHDTIIMPPIVNLLPPSLPPPPSAGTTTTTTGPPTVLVLIDFGLAKNSSSAEDRAVDLYVLERSLCATHAALLKNDNDHDDASQVPRCVQMVHEAYQAAFLQPVGGPDDDHHAASSSSSSKSYHSTMTRLDQVRLRGRKRECFG